ncbi:flagellar hook assembly protein FlgD [Mycetocola sp.]|uniref:flagellar hook assembly protein FlgD n=1 Tax=Mycetocola sp. TaxID=1871042 RepID=UPI0039896D3C
MPIDAIASTDAAGLYASRATTAPKQEMDGELFLSLLVTQLQNQDPSSPMDTNQMISQTTQLAMMEQITAQTKTGSENFSLQMRTAAAALMGQGVSYTGADGTTVTGVASAVSYSGPVPQVTIDGVTVALDAISGVITRPSAS